MDILLAIDETDAALQACRLVAAYAGDRSALRVTLLHVLRPPVHLLPQGGLPQPALEAALLEQGQRRLDQVRRVFEPGSFALESVVRIGAPGETILAEARERGVTALVMGSGQRGLVGGYRIGSVALRVAPAADCPVVLVRPDARLPSELGRSLRVTAPVDGSPESLRAIERLASCARLLGRVHVDLVHFQPGLSLAAAIAPPHDDIVKQWGSLESDHALEAASRTLSGDHIPHVAHRLVGAPDLGIAAFAREHMADLISMATRGRGAMHHLLMGSVALRTAHESDVPVALMR